MGHRLSKIYTRTGDSGTTGLGNGERVDKDNLRVEAIGTVDELNCHIGAILAHELPENMRNCLTEVQHDLFDLGGELCMPGHEMIKAEYSSELETWLDAFNMELPNLKEFILPGGGPAATAAHLARAVCRRAERRVTTLKREEEVSEALLAYLNRLSDLLFVVARTLCRHEMGREVLWQPQHRNDGNTDPGRSQ